MKRSQLLLAAGILALPVAAFAQTTSGQTMSTPDSKPTVTSTMGGQAAVAPAQPGTMAPANNGVRTDAASKSASATKTDPMTQPGAKSDAQLSSHHQAKTHIGTKAVSAEHPHAATETGSQVKHPEANKS